MPNINYFISSARLQTSFHALLIAVRPKLLLYTQYVDVVPPGIHGPLVGNH